MPPIKVAVLGSRGMIGAHYMQLLQDHPWFIPLADPKDFSQCRLIFSTLPKEADPQVELPLISSSSCYRQDPLVPLIIPEVNAHHLEMVRGKKSFVIAKPNCSLQSYILPLTPLHRAFGVDKIHVTTLQAISGAGKKALTDPLLQDNVIPYIPEEEEKSQREPRKIWDAPNLIISAHCNRVPVMHGHLACVSVSFINKPTEQEIVEMWKTFPSLNLPSAPTQLLHYESDPFRPQTKLDCNRERGMGITIGRLRPCPILDYRFVGISHNVVRGGAGGGILIAELLYKEGYLG